MMMTGYEVVEWRLRYEVNSRGTAAENGDKLRKAPLTYYRSKVTGTCQGLGYRKLLRIANSKALEIFGIFHKLLEIAAGQQREGRGVIKQSVPELAMIIGVDESNIEKALSVLSDKDLGWLVKLPERTGKSGDSGSLQEFTETPEKSASFLNGDVTETETDTDTDTDTETKTEKGDSDLKLPQDYQDQSVEEAIYFDFAKEYFTPSTRVVGLMWYEVVRPLLVRGSKADITCLTDIQSWLAGMVDKGNFAIKVYDEVWQWAKDAQNAERPLAVVQARLKKEMGYECKSKRIMTG